MDCSTGRLRRTALRAVTALLATAPAAGCTVQVAGSGTVQPAPPATARGAAYLAMLTLSAASAVHYRGSFDDQGDTVGLDATVTSAGEATGALTTGGHRIELLVLQGVTYLRAPEAFWTSGGGSSNGVTRRYAANWVRVPATVFGLDVGTVLAPGALARSQRPVLPGIAAGHVGDLPRATAGGVRTVRIDAQGTDYQVSADQPYRLLRLATPAVPRFAPGQHRVPAPPPARVAPGAAGPTAAVEAVATAVVPATAAGRGPAPGSARSAAPALAAAPAAFAVAVPGPAEGPAEGPAVRPAVAPAAFGVAVPGPAGPAGPAAAGDTRLARGGAGLAAVPPRPGTPVPPAPDATNLQVDLADASAGLAGVYAELARRAGGLGGAIDGAGRVRLGVQDFVGCGPGSCTISVAFTNESAAATRAGLHADFEGGRTPVGNCDGTSPPVPPHRTGTVTCTIASAAWAAFYRRASSAPGGLPYGARYSVLPLAPPPDTARLAAQVTAARCATQGPARPAGCPLPAAADPESRDAAVRTGYRALRQRFARSVPYGGVDGLRLAGRAPPAHPAAGYADLVAYFGDRVFVYQVADAPGAQAAGPAARLLGRNLAALRGAVFDRSVQVEPGPPLSVTVRDPRLGRTVALTSQDRYPGVIFYTVG
jgi:hypothetical protein